MLSVIQADLNNPEHGQWIVSLLNTYATDIMGGSQSLSDFTRNNLVKALQTRVDSLVFLAFLDGQPAGVAICFEGFSTFACKPLLNIHDFAVHPGFRRRGIGQAILRKIESVALKRGCCKLTLEVLENNNPARTLYSQAGFSGYELNPETGRALFWEKTID